GYNLLCKFDKNGSVKFAAKNEFSSNNQYAEETSLYEMIADNGPVLTFNTYNKLFHIFADPNDIPSTGEDDETGFGHEGDYEFVVHEATADQIFLKGKKYGISIYLRKLPADLAWEDYFAQVEANKAKYFNSKVKTIWLETATKRYTVQDMTSGVMSFVPEGGDAVSETLYKAYILTYDGKLHFITPFKGIDGKISVQNFDVADDGTLVCTDEGETGHFTSDPVAQMFTADAYTWRIDKNANVGSWETAYNALTNGILAYKKKSPLQYVEFSYDSKTTVEGYPYLLSIKTKSYLLKYYFNIEVTADNAVTITYGGTDDNNSKVFYRDVPAIVDFCNALCGSFTLTGNSNIAITNIVVADANGSFSVDLR
ncbi:MAG: DUF4302 domain-containing protein, partial [Bacteroidales bacterium]|nr:DUF4302 domain-containing protein [Bacteroidales bacterium]